MKLWNPISAGEPWRVKRWRILGVCLLALILVVGVGALTLAALGLDGSSPPPERGSTVTLLRVPAASPIPIRRVEESAQRWADHCWPALVVEAGPCIEGEGMACLLPMDGDCGEPDHMGREPNGCTERPDGDGPVTWATVRVRPTITRDELDHELGHVLGLGHAVGDSQLMAPIAGSSWAQLDRCGGDR